MKCEEHVDNGKTRIRGWHNFTPCKNTAKYKVTYPSGNVLFLCGVHYNRLKRLGYNVKAEEIRK